MKKAAKELKIGDHILVVDAWQTLAGVHLYPHRVILQWEGEMGWGEELDTEFEWRKGASIVEKTAEQFENGDRIVWANNWRTIDNVSKEPDGRIHIRVSGQEWILEPTVKHWCECKEQEGAAPEHEPASPVYSIPFEGRPKGRVCIFGFLIDEPCRSGYWRRVFQISENSEVSVVIERLPKLPDGYVYDLSVQGTTYGGFRTTGRSLGEVAGNFTHWLVEQEKIRREEERKLKQQSESV